MTGKITKLAGDYVVLDATETIVGTVERFDRTAGLKQWRFKLLNSASVFDGTFVALGRTRGEAAEKGVEFALQVRTLLLADRRLLADLVRLAEQYASRCTTADFQSGEAYRLLGAMDYVGERLVEGGADQYVVGKIKHHAAAREDWQVAV